MSSIPESLESLINSFSQLPGIGKKTAKRLGLFILKEDFSYAKELSASLIDVKEKIKYCKNCNNFTETEICMICNDESRSSKTICILKKASDVITFERTGYNGRYHILGNLISPVDGITEDDLNIESLLSRLDNHAAHQ